MKAAIFTPYLDTLGGGERYMLSIAKVLLGEGWQVDIQNSKPELIKKANERFSLGLENLNSVESINRGDSYELCFWLSDGSIPNLRARENILHFQRPFYKVDGKSLMNRMKFFRIHEVIVNSIFTKEWIDKEFPQKSKVIYPPVDVKKIKSKIKKNQILYVGRFSKLEQSKGQEYLIKAFKKFAKKNKDFKLILMGGSDIGNDNFVEELKKISLGHSVEIIENAPFKELIKTIGQSMFFWSAAGYKAPQDKPEKMEHFGITVAEAMSAGCVPIVFNGGGHKEIVNSPLLLWNDLDELVKTTEVLINNKKKRLKLSSEMKLSAQKFSYENFKQNILAII